MAAPSGGIEGLDVEAEFRRERLVEDHEVRVAHRRRRHARVKQGRQAGVGVFETPAAHGRGAIMMLLSASGAPESSASPAGYLFMCRK